MGSGDSAGTWLPQQGQPSSWSPQAPAPLQGLSEQSREGHRAGQPLLSGASPSKGMCWFEQTLPEPHSPWAAPQSCSHPALQGPTRQNLSPAASLSRNDTHSWMSHSSCTSEPGTAGAAAPGPGGATGQSSPQPHILRGTEHRGEQDSAPQKKGQKFIPEATNSLVNFPYRGGT